LVLDNCEHILDAVAALAGDVVARCRGVRLLAMSREPLGVPSERLVPVSPLVATDAAQLFVARLDEQGGAFGGVRGEAVDRDAVAEVCGRLDGLPLAIELAAARARTMPLGELTDRLAERFRLLRARRGRTGRHQALEATVAWSYDLLSAEEQLLFDRLSVFVGGFDLRAAEAVAADDYLDEGDVVELVGSLTDKSMLATEPSGRYRLLEILRIRRRTPRRPRPHQAAPPTTRSPLRRAGDRRPRRPPRPRPAPLDRAPRGRLGKPPLRFRMGRRRR
jgi:predicted ATPase